MRGRRSAARAAHTVTASARASTRRPLNTLISTNDQALTDVMTELAALQSIGVKTYIIGVEPGVDPAVNPMTAYQTLNAMAVAGGTNAYFPANSPGAVTADLQIIITKILAATQSTASAAVNSTGLNTNSVVYQSQFTTSDLYQDWTGNLYAFPINPTTGVVNTSPAAATLVRADATRRADLEPGPPHRHLGPGAARRHTVPVEHGYADDRHCNQHGARTGTRDLHAGHERTGRAAVLAGIERPGIAQRRSVPQPHPQARRYRQQRPSVYRPAVVEQSDGVLRRIRANLCRTARR